MRINFLPKYVKENEFTMHLLQNCTVVIDGQNFMYNIYEENKLPFVFGCEADAFAECLKKQLNIFKLANVKCYFVFKGGDKNLERKLNKIATDRHDGEKFDFIKNEKFIPPLFMKNVYKQVLDELEIPYAVCEYECKRECVALATVLNCAVISNDVEFCFLKAPYIHKDTLRYDNGKKAIRCKQYKLDHFLKKHSLSEQKLAIFAVLTDAYIFPEGTFHDFLKSLKLFNPNFFIMYQAIWQWLSKCDEDDALRTIFKSLNQAKDQFLIEMHKVMDFMETKQQSLVGEYLLNGGIINFKAKDPFWFQKGVASKKIAIPYVNLYNSNHWITVKQIEGEDSKHSLLLCMDIIKYAYNLLTDFKRDEFKLVINAQALQISAKASGDTPANIFVNGWDDIQKLELFQRFLRQNSIDVGLIAQIPSEAAILIMALVYFGRKKSCENVTVTKEVYSIIVCYVMLANPDSKNVKIASDSYFKVAKGEMMRIFDRNMIHNFVEFQHCLEQMNYLNILCGAPYTPTVYHRTYNGTFVYKLYRDLATDSDDPITFLNNAIRGSTSVSVLNNIKTLINCYEKLL